jgi:hypothetical protein
VEEEDKLTAKMTRMMCCSFSKRAHLFERPTTHIQHIGLAKPVPLLQALVKPRLLPPRWCLRINTLIVCWLRSCVCAEDESIFHRMSPLVLVRRVCAWEKLCSLYNQMGSPVPNSWRVPRGRGPPSRYLQWLLHQNFILYFVRSRKTSNSVNVSPHTISPSGNSAIDRLTSDAMLQEALD